MGEGQRAGSWVQSVLSAGGGRRRRRGRSTHIGKVWNSDVVQVPQEAAAAGRTAQETGHRATVVLQSAPTRGQHRATHRPSVGSTHTQM